MRSMSRATPSRRAGPMPTATVLGIPCRRPFQGQAACASANSGMSCYRTTATARITRSPQQVGRVEQVEGDLPRVRPRRRPPKWF